MLDSASAASSSAAATAAVAAAGPMPGRALRRSVRRRAAGRGTGAAQAEGPVVIVKQLQRKIGKLKTRIKKLTQQRNRF
eukprot:12397929-Karenia_brevis.AAC.2